MSKTFSINSKDNLFSLFIGVGGLGGGVKWNKGMLSGSHTMFGEL